MVAELLPVFVSSAELDPTATPRDMAVAERAIDEVMRPQSSVLQASEAAWVIRRAAELAESMGAARSEPGSGSWDLVGVPGLRTAVDDPVETLLYIVEPRSERARFVQHGASVPGVSRDLTEHLNVIAIRDFVMSDPVTTDKILKTLDLRRRTGSPAHTPSDVDATRIEFERAVGSALLRDAWSREHGHAPQF